MRKIKNEPVFIPVMVRISIPFNLQERQENENGNKLQEKEKIAKEHLEEMSELTRNLSYNDIKLLKRNIADKDVYVNDDNRDYDRKQHEREE